MGKAKTDAKAGVGGTSKKAHASCKDAALSVEDGSSQGRGWDRCCPNLLFTDLFCSPGHAKEVVGALSDADGQRAHAEAWLCYMRGDIDEARARAIALSKDEQPSFQARISSALLLSLAAMYGGNLLMWREARSLADASAARLDTHISGLELRFWCAALDSAIWSDARYPQRFCNGSFDFLPTDSYCAARFFYVKHLLVSSYEMRLSDAERRHRKSMLFTIAHVCEPFISQTKVEGVYIAELYLHLLCAVALHEEGEDPRAKEHIAQAIELARPDGFLSPLVEYASRLDRLMFAQLRETDDELYSQVVALCTRLGEGWTRLHNEVLGRTVSTMLTPREREISLLALTLSNKEIAAKLGISVATVKSTLRSASRKTGASGRHDLARFL